MFLSVQTRQPIRDKNEITTLAPGVPGHSFSVAEEIVTKDRSKRRKLADVPLMETEVSAATILLALVCDYLSATGKFIVHSLSMMLISCRVYRPSNGMYSLLELDETATKWLFRGRTYA